MYKFNVEKTTKDFHLMEMVVMLLWVFQVVKIQA